MLLRRFPFALAAALSSALLLNACKISMPGIDVELDLGTSPELYTSNPDLTYTKTIHPIFLVHGLNGFDHMLGVNYFYNVPEALEHGGATVVLASMSALHTNEVRGEQLLKQIKEYIAINPTVTKVNLLGHSHGAPTARYVAAVAPHLIASVSTVGGVNALGSEKAALINDAFNDPAKGLLVEAALLSLGLMFDILSTEGGRHPQTVRSTFYSVGYEGTEKFNARYPDALPPIGDPCNEGTYTVNGIRYYSWGGVAVKTNKADPLDKILEVTIPYFVGIENDGTISRCASHLGEVIRDNYNLNHTDLTNQAFGLRHSVSVNPLNLYRAHANRLKNDGF